MRKTCSAFNYSDSQLLHTGKSHLMWAPEAALPLRPHKRGSRLCFLAAKGLPSLTPDSLRDKPDCEKTKAGGAGFPLSVMLYQPWPCLCPAVTTEILHRPRPFSLRLKAAGETKKNIPPLSAPCSDKLGSPASVTSSNTHVLKFAVRPIGLQISSLCRDSQPRAGPFPRLPGWPRCPPARPAPLHPPWALHIPHSPNRVKKTKNYPS